MKQTEIADSHTGARAAIHPLLLLLICGGAFALYWYTSFVVVERKISALFGADTWFYTEFAKGDIFGRLASDYHIDRVFRFHPVTVALAAGWMKITEPLTAWIAPLHLLRAMFALIGATGVWVAISAFASALPRAQALLWGLVYAFSLNIWYFSSIEESKIISATLAVLYIAYYLRMRDRWTPRGALTLTAILLVACLNEIVAAFIVAIPAVDTLLRRGFNFRELRWIFAHALAAPAAYLLIELLTHLFTQPTTPHPEGTNHLRTLIWYVQQNSYNFAVIYAYLVRWIFFSIAAPVPNVYFANPEFKYGGDFHPALLSYFYEPVSGAIAILAIAIFLACFWRRAGSEVRAQTSLLLGFATYAIVRAIFFLLFIPKEYFLYGPSVTLTHLLLLAIPFSQSRIPGKVYILAVLATLLLINNGMFWLTVKVHE